MSHKLGECCNGGRCVLCMTPEERLAEVTKNPQPGDAVQVGDDEGTRREVTLLDLTGPSRPGLFFAHAGGESWSVTLTGWARICKAPGVRVVRMATRG